MSSLRDQLFGFLLGVGDLARQIGHVAEQAVHAHDSGKLGLAVVQIVIGAAVEADLELSFIDLFILLSGGRYTCPE